MSEDYTSRADELAQRFEDMAAAWLAEHGGGFVTGFTGIVTMVDGDGCRAWSMFAREGQDLFTTLGLLDFQRVDAHKQTGYHLDQSDEEG